ncbi:MAG TPA: M13 family metallopeptidase N-terminal domain-containing protein, partial [Steroidobacteraceae bacterium]
MSWMPALVVLAACAGKPVEEKLVPVNPLSAAPGAASSAAARDSAGATTARNVALALSAPATDGSLRGKPTIGDFGLDLSARNPQVKPGDDFFAYANGGWYDSFNIPADKSSFGPFDRLDEFSKERVRGIIAKAAAAHAAPGTPEQQIGDYYAAYMNQEAIEANGLTPAEPDLQRIAAAGTRADIARLFGEPGFASLFDVQLPPDFKNPDRYCIYITEATLGLPDRDYYLKDDPALKELRAKYVAYIAEMLTFGGVPDSTAKAQAILAFETEAAKVQWPIEKRRDVDAIYNPRTKAQLLAYAPGFAWQAFLDPQQLGARQQVVLGELTAIRDLSALFGRTSVATLRDFLTFHYLSTHAPYLPRRFDEARFAFYGQAMRGQPQQRERWKR